jgi:hypothetical protein
MTDNLATINLRAGLFYDSEVDVAGTGVVGTGVGTDVVGAGVVGIGGGVFVGAEVERDRRVGVDEGVTMGVAVAGNSGSQSSCPMLKTALLRQLACMTASTVEPESRARLNSASPSLTK